MKLQLISDDGTLLRLATLGDVTQATLQSDAEPLGATLGSAAYGRLAMLSLADSGFMDSAGVGWLLVCHKRFQSAGGRFVIHSVPPMILDMLKLLRLDQVLYLADTPEDARELATAD